MARHFAWLVANAHAIAAVTALLAVGDRLSAQQVSGEQSVPASVRVAAAKITQADLKTDLATIAHDSMAGRNTPSRGLDLTATYIASQLAKLPKLESRNSPAFQSRFPVRVHRPSTTNSFAELDGERFTMPDGFGIGSQWRGLSAFRASGSLVFVGVGWSSDSLGVDPYKQVDVRGKIVLAFRGSCPGSPIPGDWRPPIPAARAHGAVGFVWLPPSTQRDASVASTALLRQISAVSTTAYDERLGDFLPNISASRAMADAMLRNSGHTIEELESLRCDAKGPFALSSERHLTFALGSTDEPRSTQNVMAFIRGSDPQLRNEYVVIGAHYDHIGTVGDGRCVAAGADSVCNGADDNGSGSVALLALARALAEAPAPRRSIILTWFAGEEHRSVGANWFLQNPPVALDSVVLLVNLDMVGRSDRQKLRIASNSAALRELARSVALGEIRYPLELIDHDEDSDVVPFDKRGKTFLAFIENNNDHHAATDGVERIDFDYLERVARTAFMASWLAANRVVP